MTVVRALDVDGADDLAALDGFAARDHLQRLELVVLRRADVDDVEDLHGRVPGESLLFDLGVCDGGGKDGDGAEGLRDVGGEEAEVKRGY